MSSSRFRSAAFGATAFAGLTMGLASMANAGVIYAGNFSGNECGAGGFATCFATTLGTSGSGATGPGSPVIFKKESDGGTDKGNFASITGSEFVVSINATTNVLSWSYTPGANDPEVHYFAVKQANGFALFYDLTAPITSWSEDLDTWFPKNPGFSHVTFFDTGSTPPNEVPEPGTLAVFGLGLLGLGLAARRRKA